MLYEPNTTRWQVGDLVLADADAKVAKMLMIVVPKRGIADIPKAILDDYDMIALRYLVPLNGWGSTRPYWGELKYYHDPATWLDMGIKSVAYFRDIETFKSIIMGEWLDDNFKVKREESGVTR